MSEIISVRLNKTSRECEKDQLDKLMTMNWYGQKDTDLAFRLNQLDERMRDLNEVLK